MDFKTIDFKALDWKHLLTSFQGRIGREMFWVGVVGAIVVGVILGFVASFLGRVPVVGWLIALALQLVALYPGAAVCMKRLHDRDRPETWLAIYLGPSVVMIVLSALAVLLGINFGILSTLVSLASLAAFVFMLYDLGWLLGSAGPNRYGPAPAGPATAPAT